MRTWSRCGAAAACSSSSARKTASWRASARSFSKRSGRGLGTNSAAGTDREATPQEARGETLMAVIEARGIRKAFGTTVALDGVDLRVEEGRIVGLIGPNGAGKTTALNAILGLTPYQGELTVLQHDPWTSRARLMHDVAYIADVAVLPRWSRRSP